MALRAGRNRHLLEVQAAGTKRNSRGGAIKSNWATETTVWGSISPMVGKEYFAALATANAVTHEVKMRYLASLTPSHRLKHNKRVFQIRAILNPDERNRELVVMCTEKV